MWVCLFFSWRHLRDEGTTQLQIVLISAAVPAGIIFFSLFLPELWPLTASLLGLVFVACELLALCLYIPWARLWPTPR